jgi:hypothetical protein
MEEDKIGGVGCGGVILSHGGTASCWRQSRTERGRPPFSPPRHLHQHPSLRSNNSTAPLIVGHRSWCRRSPTSWACRRCSQLSLVHQQLGWQRDAITHRWTQWRRWLFVSNTTINNKSNSNTMAQQFSLGRCNNHQKEDDTRRQWSQTGPSTTGKCRERSLGIICSLFTQLVKSIVPRIHQLSSFANRCEANMRLTNKTDS